MEYGFHMESSDGFQKLIFRNIATSLKYVLQKTKMKTLNALQTQILNTFWSNKPFAIILFLFFFRFFINPGVRMESLRFRDVFLSWFWGTGSVLPRVFSGLFGVDSNVSIFAKSMAWFSFPRLGRMTSKKLPRLCPPLPRISEISGVSRTGKL